MEAEENQGRRKEECSASPNENQSTKPNSTAPREFLEIPNSKRTRDELLVIENGERKEGYRKEKNHLACNKANPDSSNVELKTFPVSESKLLSTLEAFLPAIKQANETLHRDMKEDPQGHIIEMDENDDGAHIQMDLALGVADLLTEEAVAAAERAVAVNGQCCEASESSEGSDASEDGSDKESNEEEIGSALRGIDTVFRPSNSKKADKKRPRIEEI